MLKAKTEKPGKTEKTKNKTTLKKWRKHKKTTIQNSKTRRFKSWGLDFEFPVWIRDWHHLDLLGANKTSTTSTSRPNTQKYPKVPKLRTDPRQGLWKNILYASIPKLESSQTKKSLATHSKIQVLDTCRTKGDKHKNKYCRSGTTIWRDESFEKMQSNRDAI